MAFNLGSALGGATDFLFGDLAERPTDMLTDPHSQWLSSAQQQLWNQSMVDPATGEISTDPTYDPNSPFGQAMTNALQGNPALRVDADQWGMMDDSMVNDYFNENVVGNYMDNLRPQMLASVSNLHGSHRANLEQRGIQDLARQQNDLLYRNRQRNQELLQAAGLANQGASQQSQLAAMQMYGQYDPRQQMLAMLGGQTPTSQIVQGPSTLDTLSQVAGIASAFK